MFDDSTGFAIGTGRCGTKFLSKVIELEADVASTHERSPLNDTFHRYSKWYNLPMDHEGFLQRKESTILKDLETHTYSFEASPFVSLSTPELYKRFKSKFIFLVRSPEKVVNSFLHKGWYQESVDKACKNLPPSYQGNREFHHFLARVMPLGEEFERWKSMTRVGKIAWYWNAFNKRIIQDLSTLPENCWRMVKLEELTYERYFEVAQFLGFNVTVSKNQYDELTQLRPNRRRNLPAIALWDAREILEFETEIYPMSKELGYEYRMSYLKQDLCKEQNFYCQNSQEKSKISKLKYLKNKFKNCF